MFGNPKGELRICSECDRPHDILRGTMCICACGKVIYSKEYSETKMLRLMKEDGGEHE